MDDIKRICGACLDDINQLRKGNSQHGMAENYFASVQMIGSLKARIAKLEAGIGEICKESNLDWDKCRDHPIETIEHIHARAVSLFYDKMGIGEQT